MAKFNIKPKLSSKGKILRQIYLERARVYMNHILPDKFKIRFEDPKLFKHLPVVKVKVLQPEVIQAMSSKKEALRNQARLKRNCKQKYSNLDEEILCKSPEPEKEKKDEISKKARKVPRHKIEATSSATHPHIQQSFSLQKPKLKALDYNYCWRTQSTTRMYTKTKAALKSYSTNRNENCSSRIQTQLIVGSLPRLPPPPHLKSGQSKIPPVQVSRGIQPRPPTKKTSSSQPPFLEKFSKRYNRRGNFSTGPPKLSPPHSIKGFNASVTKQQLQALAKRISIYKNTPKSLHSSSAIPQEQRYDKLLALHKKIPTEPTPIQPLHLEIQLAKAIDDAATVNFNVPSSFRMNVHHLENELTVTRAGQNFTPKLPPDFNVTITKLPEKSQKTNESHPKSTLPLSLSHEDINPIQSDQMKSPKSANLSSDNRKVIDLTSSDEYESEPNYPSASVLTPPPPPYCSRSEMDSGWKLVKIGFIGQTICNEESNANAETAATLTTVASPPDYCYEVDVTTSSPFFDHQADVIKNTFPETVVDKPNMTCQIPEMENLQLSTTITNAREEIINDNGESEKLTCEKAILKDLANKPIENDPVRESWDSAANTGNQLKERPTLLNTQMMEENNSIENKSINKEIQENDLTPNVINSESLRILDDGDLANQNESNTEIEIQHNHNADAENETFEKNDSTSFSINQMRNIENGHFGIIEDSDCSGNGSNPHQLPPKKRTTSFSCKSELTKAEENPAQNDATEVELTSLAENLTSSEAQTSPGIPQSFIINDEPMQEDAVNTLISNPNPSQNLEPKEKPIPSNPDVAMEDVTHVVNTDNSDIESLGSADIPSNNFQLYPSVIQHTRFCENYQSPTMIQPYNNFCPSQTEHQSSPLIPVHSISGGPPSQHHEIETNRNGERPNGSFVQPQCQYEPISPPESPAFHNLEIHETERIIFHLMSAFCEAIRHNNNNYYYSRQYFYPMNLSQEDCNIVNNILAEICNNLDTEIQRILPLIFEGHRAWILQILFQTSSFASTNGGHANLTAWLHYEQKNRIVYKLYDLIREWLKAQFQEWHKKCNLAHY